jgi:hypothetical protein
MGVTVCDSTIKVYKFNCRNKISAIVRPLYQWNSYYQKLLLRNHYSILFAKLPSETVYS